MTALGRQLRRAHLRLARLGYFRGPLLMSWLRKRWVLLRNPQATVRFGRDTYLGPGFSLHAPFGGTFITGERVEFRRNFRAELGAPEARISFGDRTICTYDVLVQCSTTVAVGADCIIAQSVALVDGNHRFRDLDQPVLEQGYDWRPLDIRDGATVMSKCTVLAGLGERCFVGAHAVVTRPVPAFCLALGVPARPVEYYGAGAPPPELR